MSKTSPYDGEQLLATVEALASIGERRVGTPEGVAAAEYIQARFEAAGLTRIRKEPFRFPRHDVRASSLAVATRNGGRWLGTERDISHNVFEGSGTGHVRAELCAVGGASPEELDDLALDGRIALVERRVSYHRSTQYRNVASRGAVAMVDISAAADNLRQVGSIRRSWESMGSIPAVTVGAQDGAQLLASLQTGERIGLEVAVDALTMPGVGQNVLGEVVGQHPSECIVVGAHFDSWFADATDNGGGVAAMVALAQWCAAQRQQPEYTLVFAAFDGEEIALYGAYDFLRRHVVSGQRTVRAILNLETPSAHGASMSGLACSGHRHLDDAIRVGNLAESYSTCLPMELVPQLFGGIIPADIQGFYRSGIPAMSTAVDAPYYHTCEDTPDKLDLPFLAAATERCAQVLQALAYTDSIRTPSASADGASEGSSGGAEQQSVIHDPAVWHIRVAISSGWPLAGYELAIEVADAQGEPQGNVELEATLFHDDFHVTQVWELTTDMRGRAQLPLPKTLARRDGATRHLHVTAGRGYPLAERIIALADPVPSPTP